MTTPPCCACRSLRTTLVLDLGTVPPADVFPERSDPGPDPSSPLAMMLCADCALAQIVHDDTAPEVPLGVEPHALVEQAEAAVSAAASSGWLPAQGAGSTVREFSSPHGGTWVPLLAERGYVVAEATTAADVVLDSFGVMHEADQQAAWQARADATSVGGTLLVQVHTLAAIVRAGQWTSLRHGHAAYYSLTSLRRLLAAVGMSVVDAQTFPLYGSSAPGTETDGTLLVAARHGDHPASERVEQIMAAETRLGVADPTALASLQDRVDGDAQRLRDWLTTLRDAGTSVMAYGAASRTVALFALARLDHALVAAVADGSPAKQGRRMPATDIPIVSPDDLVAASPDRVYVTLPDLEPELRHAWPQLAGRWIRSPEDPC